MPQSYYTHVQEALDILTGPIGGAVEIFTNGDTDDFHDGILRDRVVMGDHLEAVVIEVAEGRRATVRWATVDVLLQIPQETPS